MKEKIIQNIAYCLNAVGQCGLHIVIDDGNIENHNIQFCLDNLDKYCAKQDTEKAKQIVEYLLMARMNERFEVIYYGFGMYLKNKKEVQK